MEEVWIIILIIFLVIILYFYNISTNSVNLVKPRTYGETIYTTNMKKRFPVGTILTTSLPSEIQTIIFKDPGITPTVDVTPPDSFDARDKWPGLITGALSQNQCSSCWIYATSTAMSDRWRIKYGGTGNNLTQMVDYYPNYPNLSESYKVLNNISPLQVIGCFQCNYLLSHNPQLMNWGKSQGICEKGNCGPGMISWAYDFLIQQGANTMLDINPKPCNPNSVCSCNFEPNKPVFKGKSRYLLTLPSDSVENKLLKIKKDLIAFGPLALGFTVYSSFYSFFEKNPTGIYTAADAIINDTIVGAHAVVLVSYGVENGQEYFGLRNSWSQDGWGDNGFFKMATNIDGILTEVWGIQV